MKQLRAEAAVVIAATCVLTLTGCQGETVRPSPAEDAGEPEVAQQAAPVGPGAKRPAAPRTGAAVEPGRLAGPPLATQPTIEDRADLLVETYRFYCHACRGEFSVRATDLPDYWWEYKPTDPHRLDCPKCGAKRSCQAMSKCPKCGKWFVAPEMGDMLICPHCGTDVGECVLRQRPK